MDENLGGAPLLSKSHSNCPAKVGEIGEAEQPAWSRYAAGRQVGRDGTTRPRSHPGERTDRQVATRGKPAGWLAGEEGR